MNNNTEKILSELEENDKEILDLLEKLATKTSDINKRVDIMWNYLFGKGINMADYDLNFPVQSEVVNDDDNDEDNECGGDDCIGCPDYYECHECLEEVLETPKPVKFFKNKQTGFLVSVNDIGTRAMIEKIGEELLEATVEYGKFITDDDECGNYAMAMEIADTITACVSLLEHLGYDAKERAKLYKNVNKKNESRGYLK